MNYLKEINKIKTYEGYKASELERQAAKASACRIIDFLAQKMYEEETNRESYKLWEAIQNIIEAIKCQND